MASLLRGRHLPLYSLLSAHKKEKRKEKERLSIFYGSFI